MIFYFSGTGNSKYIATAMQDDNIIDIAKALRSNQLTYEIKDNESIGMVMPVYYSGIPKTVIDFVRGLSIKGEISYLYCVLTHGGGPGGAGSMLESELKKKGYPLHAYFDVRMGSNYIMFGDLKPDEKLIAANRAAMAEIENIKKRVDDRELCPGKWSKLDCILTASMKMLCCMNMPTKKFYADDNCTGCGLCASRCPSGIIKMVDGKPKWTDNKCVRCMGCLQCEHVQYGKGTCSRRRYSFDKYR